MPKPESGGLEFEAKKQHELQELARIEAFFENNLKSLPTGYPKTEGLAALAHQIKQEIDNSKRRAPIDTSSHRYARLSPEELEQVVQSFKNLCELLENRNQS